MNPLRGLDDEWSKLGLVMSHPECFERLRALHRAGKVPDRRCWVSDEDTLARADTLKFVDSHVPMALEHTDPQLPPGPETPSPFYCRGCAFVPQSEQELATHAYLAHGQEISQETIEREKPKRTRRPKLDERAKASQKGYKMALSLAERERKKAETARRREELKAQRAEERLAAKEAALFNKIQQAEGGEVQLPAAVLRDGTVVHVSDVDAWAIIELSLDELGLDCETSGYPPGHRLYEHRTTQLGGEHAVVVFDMADAYQRDIASLGLKLARKLRSFSSTADNVPCVLSGLIGWEEMWAKTQDAVLDVKMTDPKMSGSSAEALKELSRDLLREYAVSPNAEKAKNELFKAMGCTSKPTLMTSPEKNGWYSVNRNSVVMTRYAGSDVLDMMAALRVLPPVPVSEAVMEREREFQAACSPVTLHGYPLDIAHIRMKIAEAEAAKADSLANVLMLSYGRIVNPKSSDVLKILPELIPGLVLPLDRKTKRPTAGKEALESLCRDYTAEEFPVWHFLFKEIARYRREDTKLGLLLRPLEALCDHGDGRMRPTVYTIEASTGRASCVRPNGMQFSRQGGIRACVTAGEAELELVNGQWVIVSAA